MKVNDTLDAFISKLAKPVMSPAREPGELINEAARAVVAHAGAKNNFERGRVEQELEYLKLLALLNIANELHQLNKYGLVLEKP